MTQPTLSKYAIGPRYCSECGTRLLRDMLNPEDGEKYCCKCDRVFGVK